MRSEVEVREAFRLADTGMTQMEIASSVGVGQRTVSRWLQAGIETVLSSPMRADRCNTSECPEACPRRMEMSHASYAYLLGQYLGDGTIVHTPGDVYRFFLSCCATYGGIIAESRAAILAVLPLNSVGERRRSGAVELNCRSKHWPCLLPQHGPGKKHTRPIILRPWQARIVLEQYPRAFIRGLIHSDGCRSINTVRSDTGRVYKYPRYQFTNYSDDIRELFTDACDRVGVRWRQMNRYNISVARRESVALLDRFVGPKY